jgi:tRNA A-37 threonylcarbamoyl transferase component Bud32
MQATSVLELSTGSLVATGTFTLNGTTGTGVALLGGRLPVPSTRPQSPSGLSKALLAAVIASAVGAALLAGILGAVWARRRRQRLRYGSLSLAPSGGASKWSKGSRQRLLKGQSSKLRRASLFAGINSVPYTEIHFAVDLTHPSKRRVLGSGAYGTTYAATYKGQRVAVKQMFVMQEALTDESLREARIQMSLRHPYVMPCLGLCTDVYDDLEHPCVYLVMPLKEMDLSRRLYDAAVTASLTPLPLFARLRIAWQVALALQYLHGLPEPIVHADVKPANVLLDAEGSACLADFGISKARARDASMTRTMGGLGTPPYRAPELALSTGGMRPACDMYSFGILAWELAAGRRPPCSDDPTERPPLETLPLASLALPAGFGGFLQQLWCANREERLTADDAVRYLRSHLPAECTSER